MTGTAMTEANDSGRSTSSMSSHPTNKPLVRLDFPDMIYMTEKEKWDAVVEEIERIHKYDC